MAIKEITVAQAAARTPNRRGGVGVGTQYIRDEIARGRLKARLEDKPLVGKPYYMIEETAFEEWLEKRGRNAPEKDEP